MRLLGHSDDKWRKYLFYRVVNRTHVGTSYVGTGVLAHTAGRSAGLLCPLPLPASTCMFG